MLTSLNAALEPRSILREIGIPVNQIPAFAHCPVCRAGDFFAAPDPRGGGWYTCAACNFSGDSPHMLAYAAGSTVSEIIDRMKVAGPVQTFDPARIAQYFAEIEDAKQLKEHWDRWSGIQTLHNGEDDVMLGLLDAYGLLPLTDRKTWVRRMGRYMGFAKKSAFIRATGITRLLPGRESRGFLFTPMFDVPGRICGFQGLYVWDGEKRAIELPMVGDELDGLAFLSTAHIWEDVIYATSHIPFVTCAQIRANTYSQPLMPFVGYTNGTTRAWNTIIRAKVVFWDPKISDSTFLAARKMPERAEISVEPQLDPSDDPFLFLESKNPMFLLGVLRKHAKPWLAVLKDYLLAKDHPQTAALLSRLDLTPQHRKTMLEMCTETERDRLSSMIDKEVIELSIVGKANKKLIQRADGWFIESNDKERRLQLISDAIPIIEHHTEFRYRTTLSGVVKIRNKTIPFNVDRNEFTVDWLETLCRQKAKELIKINSYCSDSDLQYYALQFHPPIHVAGIACLGWEEDSKSFVFPRLIVMPNGEFMGHFKPLEAPHPVEQLHDPRPVPVEQLEDWVTPKPDRLAFWDLYCRVFGNLLAPARHNDTYGVAVVGNVYAHAQRLAQYVATAMHLNTHTLNTDQGDSAVEALVAREAEHNMPLFVQANHPSGYLRWLQRPGNRNALVAIPSDMRRAFELRGGWEIVDMGNLQDFDFKISLSLMPTMLGWYQYKEMHETRDGYMPSMAFKVASSWIDYRKPGLATEISSLAGWLNKSRVSWQRSTADRFLATLLQLVEARALVLEEYPTSQLGEPHEMATGQIALTAETVWIDMESVRKIFDRRQLHMPPVAELVRSFRDSEYLLREVYGLSDLKGLYLNRACFHE